MDASRAGAYAVVAIWGLAVTGVWLWTTDYEFSTYPTPARFQRDRWPDDARLSLADDRPTLLLFIHPRCPCTRASIRELEVLLTGPGIKPRQRPKLIIVATIPAGASADWRRTDTIRRVARLPGATVHWDVDGTEAGRFGAIASGAVMLYVPSGERLFAGGVTASRGHEGDNAGRDRLRRILVEAVRSPQGSTPAFGCKLCVAEPAEASGATCDSHSACDIDLIHRETP